MQPRRRGSPVHHLHPDQHIVDVGLGIFDKDIEIAILVKQARVE